MCFIFRFQVFFGLRRQKDDICFVCKMILYTYLILRQLIKLKKITF